MKQVSADDIKQYINALTADSFEQKAVSCCGCSSTYATPQGLQKHLKGHGAADEDLKPLLDNHEVDPVHQVGHKDEHTAAVAAAAASAVATSVSAARLRPRTLPRTRPRQKSTNVYQKMFLRRYWSILVDIGR